MNKSLGTVGSVVLTFFVTLVLNTLLNFYTSEKGSVSVSRPIQIDGSRVVVVTMENQSSDFLNGLVIEIPAGVKTTSLVAEPAITIEDVASSQGKQKLLKLGQISPRLVSRLFVPIPEGTVRIANADASGVALRQDDRLESPLRIALLSALFVAVLYALVEGVSTFHASRKRKALREEIASLRKDHDAAAADAKQVRSDLEGEVKSVNARVAKHRILLQARLFDYSKELEFWRNTIRSLLLDSGSDKRTPEELISKVTASLGTYGTKSSGESYETIRVAARWLSEAEQGGVDDKST